jgi:signal transduction histidine kinase
MRLPRKVVLLSALGVGIFQIVGTFGAADDQTYRKPVDALAIALVIVGPIALAVRDRRPLIAVAASVLAADVYIGLGYPYGPIFFSPAIALFAAVQAGKRREATILAAAGFVSYIVASTLDPKADDGWRLAHFALVSGWLVMLLAISELVRVRRAQFAERQRMAEDDERRRVAEQRLLLAQELHDVLAHNISLINVQASVALHLIDDKPDQARPALLNIKVASHDALQELRTALDVLRRGEAAPRSPAPTLDDLDSLIEGVRSSGLDVQIEVDGSVRPFPAAVELAAYRIVQEALTNITRHARARHVTVRLGYHDAVDIEVLDDGVGGLAQTGNGILGMRERAVALGGSVDAGPRRGGGFRVSAHLPERQT